MFFVNNVKDLAMGTTEVDRDSMMMKSLFMLIFDEEEHKMLLCKEGELSMLNTKFNIVNETTDGMFKLSISFSKYELIFTSDYVGFSIEVMKSRIRNKYIRSKSFDEHYFFISPDEEDGVYIVDFLSFAEATVEELAKRFGSRINK